MEKKELSERAQDMPEKTAASPDTPQKKKKRSTKIAKWCVGILGTVLTGVLFPVLVNILTPAVQNLLDNFLGRRADPGVTLIETAEAAESVIALQVSLGDAELHPGRSYCLLSDEEICISALPGMDVADICYAIGAGGQRELTDVSSCRFSVPESYLTAGNFPLGVCARLKDGSFSDWQYYTLRLYDAAACRDTALLLSDSGSLLPNDGSTVTVPVYGRQELALTVQQNGAKKVSELCYQVAEDFAVTVDFNGSYGFSVPCASYLDADEVSVSLSGVFEDGTPLPESDYRLKLVSAETELPLLQVSCNRTVLSTANRYIVDSSAVLELSVPGEAAYVYYKIGTGDTVRTEGKETLSVEIPASYTDTGEFTFNVCYMTADGRISPWCCYRLIAASADLAEPTVSCGKDTLKMSRTYTCEVGCEVQIRAPREVDVKKVYYKIGTRETCHVDGNAATVAIPSDYKDTGEFSFNVCYVTADGRVSPWFLYRLQMK